MQIAWMICDALHMRCDPTVFDIRLKKAQKRGYFRRVTVFERKSLLRLEEVALKTMEVEETPSQNVGCGSAVLTVKQVTVNDQSPEPVHTVAAWCVGMIR